MINLHKILLPTDFSPKAATLASHARIISKQFGGRVILLHVVRPFQIQTEGMEPAIPIVVDWYNEQKPILENTLREFAATYLPGVPVSLIVVEGEPGTEILRVAHEEQVDVILIPTHGHSAFQQMLLGSTAAKVLQDSPVPVLTGVHIDAPMGERETIERVLVAVDIGPHAIKLVTIGANLAKEFGARLTVLHVTPEDETGASRFIDPGWQQQRMQEIETDLEQLALQTGGPVPAVELVAGDPPQVVRQTAEKTRADLLIIGRSMDSSVIGRMSKQSDAIVRESPCPVLSI